MLVHNRGIIKHNIKLIWLVARVFDLLSILGAAFVAYYLRFEQFSIASNHSFYWFSILSAIMIAALAFPFFNLYQSWRGRSWAAHIWSVFLACLMVMLVIALGFVAYRVSEDYSRLWFFYWFILSFFFIVSFRFVTYLCLMWLRRQGYNHRNVLIVGAGHLGRSILENIQHSEWIGYDVLGFMDDNQAFSGQKLEGIPIYTDLDNIENYIDDNNIEEVWIALPLRAEKRMKQLMGYLQQTTVNIKLIPDLFGLELLNHSITKIATVPVIDLSVSPMYGWKRVMKFWEDLILGILIFVLIFPLLVLIAVAIRLSSPGPVIFKQKRHGWDGKKINVYKFRTMFHQPKIKDKVVQAKKGDSRITPLGRFLRKTSLDELPQFYNVLQGRMSIVGPRPHAVEHNEFYKCHINRYMLRHKVKPGITGWAQINGYRGETSTLDKMEKRIEYDLYYIQNWSLLLDLKIIMLTVFKGFVDKNAY